MDRNGLLNYPNTPLILVGIGVVWKDLRLFLNFDWLRYKWRLLNNVGKIKTASSDPMTIFYFASAPSALNSLRAIKTLIACFKCINRSIRYIDAFW